MRKQQIEFLKELRERIEKDCEGYFPELDEMGEVEQKAYMIEELRYYDNSDPEDCVGMILIDGYDGDEYADEDIDLMKEQLEEDAEELGFEGELADCKTVDDVIGLMRRHRIESSKEDRVWIRYLHSYWAINYDHGPFLTYDEARRYLTVRRRAFGKLAEPVKVKVPRRTDLAELLRIVRETDWEGEQ